MSARLNHDGGRINLESAAAAEWGVAGIQSGHAAKAGALRIAPMSRLLDGSTLDTPGIDVRLGGRYRLRHRRILVHIGTVGGKCVGPPSML